MNEREKHKLMQEEDAMSDAMFEIACEKRQLKALEESDKLLNKLDVSGVLMSGTVKCPVCGLEHPDIIELSCPKCGVKRPRPEGSLMLGA